MAKLINLRLQSALLVSTLTTLFEKLVAALLHCPALNRKFRTLLLANLAQRHKLAMHRCVLHRLTASFSLRMPSRQSSVLSSQSRIGVAAAPELPEQKGTTLLDSLFRSSHLARLPRLGRARSR